MKSLAVLLLLSCALLVPTAWADDTFPDVQYISGKAGFEKKVKGTLTLTATELRFTDSEAKPVFSIPLTEIKEVSNSVESNPGSTGAKIMLGVFASKKEEFVYITTETKTAAEALVFKVKNKRSPAIVAKMKFQLKDAVAKSTNEAPVATSTSTDAIPVASPDSSGGRDSLMAK